MGTSGDKERVRTSMGRGELDIWGQEWGTEGSGDSWGHLGTGTAGNWTLGDTQGSAGHLGTGTEDSQGDMGTVEGTAGTLGETRDDAGDKRGHPW